MQQVNEPRRHDGPRAITPGQTLPGLDKAVSRIETGPDGLLFDRAHREQFGQMPVEPAEHQVFEATRALHVAHHHLRLLMDRTAARHGLGESRMRLLFILKREPAYTLGQLADLLETSPRNVTGLVDSLERDGLVERVPDQQDRRAVRARITDAGRQRLRAVKRDMTKAGKAATAAFQPAELDQLRHLCLKLALNAQHSDRDLDRRGE